MALRDNVDCDIRLLWFLPRIGLIFSFFSSSFLGPCSVSLISSCHILLFPCPNNARLSVADAGSVLLSRKASGALYIISALSTRLVNPNEDGTLADCYAERLEFMFTIFADVLSVGLRK